MTLQSRLASQGVNGNGQPKAACRVPTDADLANYVPGYMERPEPEPATPIERVHGNFRVVSAHEVVPKVTEWLWPGWIPRGKLTLACGAPGIGKTYATCRIAANVTTGKLWPDGSASLAAGDVLIFSAEDDPDETIVPRLIQAGADLQRVRIVQSRIVEDECGRRERRVDLGRDVDQVGDLLDSWPETSLVVLDPIVEFAGRFESNGNIETREALAPIVDLAARRRVAILGITHFSKSVTGNALSKAIGSVAFVAVSRVVWCIAADPSDADRRLMLPLKNNLSKAPAGLGFRIGDDGLHWDTEPVNVTADEALADRKGKQPDRLNEAVAFVRERLADGCCESSQLDAEAMTRGISRKTLWRARKEVGVRAAKSTLDGKWYVSLGTEEGEERQSF